MTKIRSCAVCGGSTFKSQVILWQSLVKEWGLTEDEAYYINRQQGTCCNQCGCNLRSIALAKSILVAFNAGGTFKRFLHSPRAWFYRVLEINQAGSLTSFLQRMPRRTLAVYPDVDMQQMPYNNNHFDLVIHSDTLEHVPNPVKALSECLRVLKPGGFCCFTIPIIIGRKTKSRSGFPPSYHGGENDNKNDFIVQTEYGADFWLQLFEAEFMECRIVSVEFPSAQAIVARKAY